MKVIYFIIIFLIGFTSLSLAAEIHGSVYGPSLNKIQNIVVELDSSPRQRLVSKSGEYVFLVNPGRNYTVQARLNNTVIAQDSVVVSEEGSFVIDLFVFPDFSEEEKLFAEADEPDPSTPVESQSFVKPALIGLILLGIVLGIVFKVYGKKKVELPVAVIKEEKLPENDLEKILEILKAEGGRMNQKELRKHFPLSEAKVSLMIAELEAKGRIEKIKKGRGNILILKNE